MALSLDICTGYLQSGAAILRAECVNFHDAMA